MIDNKTLIGSLDLLYAATHHAVVMMPYPVICAFPSYLSLEGKAVSGTMVLIILMQVYKNRHLGLDYRTIVIALMAVLSVCVAPVPWKHAYVVTFLPLCILWVRTLKGRLKLCRGVALELYHVSAW